MSASRAPVRWGILGPGRIAAKVAADIAISDGARGVAVASRSIERAGAFAEQHGLERAYGSYAELLADPDVDAVYVATPHAQHHLVTSQVIAAGKPALVEKAFTCSGAASRDLAAQARAAGVFVMEGLWYRFQPGYVQLRELLADGAIGEIRSVQADLGFVEDFDPTHRLYDPAQGGGALLDLGVYPVSFAQMVVGEASAVHAVGVLAPNGVDVECGILVGYPSGAHATLSCTLAGDAPGQAAIIGAAGRVIIPPRFHHPATISVERRGHDPLVIDNPLRGNGFTAEIEHVGRCLAEGLTESPVVPLDASIQIADVLDQALDQLGAPHVDEGFTA